MASTTVQFGTEQAIALMNTILKAIDNATKMVYQAYWRTLLSFLSEHLLAILVALIILFFIALAEAITDRWAMLGSVLYNYLYFGILFIIGKI